ncbi:MAG TPA: efflux RND transporter periplasmic adaptor subunit [Candidatus Saccharimonadales bacterium]|nr:efflux RND transporter periplasmic adaptor subunit [Candidatus Saccharimonadales bacterium]
MSIRSIFTKKKIIWTIIILLVVGGGVYYKLKPKNNAANISTATVIRQNLEQTILTTGQVVSEINLNLSFQTSGVVQEITVKTGDQVKVDDVIATLSQANVKASLTSANGQLAQAQANYQRVIAGTTPEQINVSEKAVASAKVAYDNTVNQLETIKVSTDITISQAQFTLDDLQSPTSASDNKRSAILVNIANQLVAVKSDLDKQKQILDDDNLKNVFGVTDSSSLNNFKSANNQVQALLTKANSSLATAQSYKSDANIYQAVDNAVAALNQNIAALNYCYTALQSTITSSQFSQTQLDSYKLTVSTALSSENSGINLVKSSRQALTDALTAAINAVANAKQSATSQINSAQNQINSAQAAWQQAQATLAQQEAKAQPADINAAKAQLLSAQGTVEAAQTALENTILKAPADGTITKIDTKVGQQATAMQPVFILQNINALHTEAYVSESNVASLQIGQTVDYTFDAFGPDQHFSGKILTIDPASTVISGVVNYLVKADLSSIPDIKPGMTANMTIMVATRENALAVMSSAIINQNSNQYVRVINNPQTKTFDQVPVVTGLQADGGLVEILSGLNDNQEIVTLIK